MNYYKKQALLALIPIIGFFIVLFSGVFKVKKKRGFWISWFYGVFSMFPIFLMCWLASFICQWIFETFSFTSEIIFLGIWCIIMFYVGAYISIATQKLFLKNTEE